MNNNEAFIVTVSSIEKIENADKIVKVNFSLNGIPQGQVVAGLNDFKENDLAVFFDGNLCIDQYIIDSLDKLSLNYGKDGFNSIGNYLAKNNRVRIIKLRGVTSVGLIISVEKFEKIIPQIDYIEGLSFTELNNIPICHKYLPPIKGQPQVGGKKGQKGKVESRMVVGQFAFHVDTQMLTRNAHMIHPEQIIAISNKWHGTSAICSNSLVKRKLSIKEKIAKFIGVQVDETTYDYLYASRKVVKNDTNVQNSFYDEDVWTMVGKENFYSKLYQGETIYYEIVGYLSNEKFIQKDYDYGCLPKQHKIKVYRITKTGLDGNVVEYSWNKVKERCVELNVEMVDEIYHGKAKDMYDIPVDENWNINFIERLRKDYLEKNLTCNLCKKVPDEGVVVRVDGGGIEVYKLKSEAFYLKESADAEKDGENVEDLG